MRKKRFNVNLIMDSRGSTLITVIVAIAFVTILTTIILGTTVVNVRMKGIDRRTHDDFYYAEKSLNDIYTGIGQELAVIAGQEYDAAFKKVGESDAYSTSKAIEKEFRSRFIEKAYERFKDIDKEDLEEYIQSTSKGKVEKDPAVKCLTKSGEECDADSDGAYRIIINNVQVSVTDSSQYRSVISTDIIVDIPTLDFLGTNVDVSDYGIIANKGLYILGTTGKTTINGNVYAGVYESSESDYPNNSTDLDYGFYEINDRSSKKVKILGGINIENPNVEFNSNYIISKGDINVAGKNTKVTVNSDAANLSNLWTTSLRTIENHSDPLATSGPKLNINANVFALNDMILNTPYSDVTISGNYYGYNDKSVLTELESEPDKMLTVDSSKREDGVSSAIIINGVKSSLDMTGVNNFVLMGKAYIDFTSDSQTDTDAMNSNSLKQVVPTAEGVALKTNQQLYLVPPDFLDKPNPMMESVGTKFELSISHSDYENWFGYKYLRNYDPDGVDSNSDDFTHQSYTVTLNDGSKVYYDYLVFDENKKWKPVYSGGTIIRYDEDTSDNPLGTGGSVSSKAAFFFEIMNSVNTYDPSVEVTLVQPSAHRLYERILLSLNNSEYFDLKKCVVGGGATDAHYYAKNAVVNYKRESGVLSSTIFNNNEGMGRFLGYPQYLFHRYVHLCTDLDAKEYIPLGANPDYKKGSSAPNPDDTPDFSEWKVDTKTPLKHFVILDNIESNADLSKNQASANAVGIKSTAFGVFIETKPTSGELSLGNSDVVKVGTNLFRGVALVDGDIRVPVGMNVDGLLMATGKIILEGNNTINYNKGLIQSRIEKEMSIVRNSTEVDAYKSCYLISYFSNKDGTTRLYDVEPGSKIKRERIEADYNDFMHYENWQKGANDATPTPTPSSEP